MVFLTTLLQEWVILSTGLGPPPKLWHTLSKFSIDERPFFLLLGGKPSESGDFDPFVYYYNFDDSQWTVSPFKASQVLFAFNCADA